MEIRTLYVSPTSIPSRLKCPICTYVYEVPIRLQCGHTFCESCIKGSSKTNNLCPLCRTKLTDKKLKLDKIAYNILGEFEMYCFYFTKGCREKGKRVKIHIHEKDCYLKLIPESIIQKRVLEETGDDALDEKLANNTNRCLMAEVIKKNARVKGKIIRCDFATKPKKRRQKR